MWKGKLFTQQEMKAVLNPAMIIVAVIKEIGNAYKLLVAVRHGNVKRYTYIAT